MAAQLASARQSQLVTTYGVGALFPAQNESFMVMGLDDWSTRSPEIVEPRLARALGVTSFRAPAAGSSNNKDVPVIRFPEWHFCPECRRLAPIRDFCSWNENVCHDCGGAELVPSRFVSCCTRGHIDDFPYRAWVHAGRGRMEGVHNMTLEARGVSSSLADIVVKCSCGVPPVTMEGAFNAEALRGVSSCRGRRPWLGADSREACTEVPRALQRGSSNVWFPTTASAISIPPWSEGAYRLLDRYWRALEAVPLDVLATVIEGMKISDERYPSTALVEAALRRRNMQDQPGDVNEDDLRIEEYRALCAGREEESRHQEFVCTAEQVPASLTVWLEQVGRVSRLREVRALTGFTRIFPTLVGDAKAAQAPLALNGSTWLPASEVIGEGIFLKFSPEALGRWESGPFALGRAATVQASLDRVALDRGLAQHPVVTARELLLHSFSHALIDQLSLDAGYPSASLRERLYTSGETCGVLIYTATSDAAGSLGGLAALSSGDRLEEAIATCLERMAWCSSDPVCIESQASGMDGLNLAACHSCLLLPETSCEHTNTFLDRACLVGLPQSPSDGFFGEVGR